MARPTEYDQRYCALAEEQGKLGKSKAQIAAEIGVHRETLDNWAKTYPEFFDSITRARDFALAWWENQGQDGLWFDDKGQKMNAQLWSRSMAARFPDDYREKQDLNISGNLNIGDRLARAAKEGEE